ncbi:HNH endonuclease [Sinorhizobium meliloti]
MRFIEDVVIPHRGEECLLWPYGKVKGYGKVRVDGKDTLANRYVCERTHGAPPKPEHQAAHSCGNRACVNPSHLGWKTQSENEGDKLVHGTHSRGDRSARAKLTECQAREVISLRGVKFQREIAATFGVTRAAISMIHRGINWGWIDEDVS